VVSCRCRSSDEWLLGHGRVWGDRHTTGTGTAVVAVAREGRGEASELRRPVLGGLPDVLAGSWETKLNPGDLFTLPEPFRLTPGAQARLPA
jgi:hypothetical protein